MPERFPNVSNSGLIHEVEKEVTALRQTIDECEDAIKAAYERVRVANDPSDAQLAAEGTETSLPPKPTVPADPAPVIEPTIVAEAATPAPEAVAPVPDPALGPAA